jgi:hypothetical protein
MSGDDTHTEDAYESTSIVQQTLVFRIRKQYFNAISNSSKSIEYRRDSAFWQKRLEKFEKVPNRDAWMPLNLTAVFISGKEVRRKRIIYIERIITPDYFLEQGKQDVDTPTCLAFHLTKIKESKP